MTELVQSGVTGIDEVLGGGFPPNRLYLIEGESGSGKTTLGLQFLLEGAKNNEKVLYIGTSETEEDIRAVAASHGWPLEGVTLFHHKGERNEPELGQTVIHPAEIDLPQTMETILAVVENEKPERLVIDSLTEIRLLAREAHWYWKRKRPGLSLNQKIRNSILHRFGTPSLLTPIRCGCSRF